MSQVNIVRLSKGTNFVRFEIAKGTTAATMHNSRGEKRVLDLAEVRERMANLMADGWVAAAV